MLFLLKKTSFRPYICLEFWDIHYKKTVALTLKSHFETKNPVQREAFFFNFSHFFSINIM